LDVFSEYTALCEAITSREHAFRCFGRLLEFGIALDQNVGHDDVGASPRQGEAIRTPETPGAAGDEGDSSREIEHLS